MSIVYNIIYLAVCRVFYTIMIQADAEEREPRS